MDDDTAVVECLVDAQPGAERLTAEQRAQLVQRIVAIRAELTAKVEEYATMPQPAFVKR